MREGELSDKVLGSLGLFEGDQASHARFEVFERLGADLIRASTVQEVVDFAHLSLEAYVDPESFSLFMPVPDTEEIECVAVSSSAHPRFREFVGFRASIDSMTGSVYRDGIPWVSTPPHRDPRLDEANRRILEALDVSLFIAMPLRVVTRVIGVLILSWTGESPPTDVATPVVEIAAAYVAIAIDRIVHEAAVAESAARNDAVIYSLAEGLVTTDSAGRIVNWNRAMEALTGRSEEAVKGGRAVEEIVLFDESGNELDAAEHPVAMIIERVEDGVCEVEASIKDSAKTLIPVRVETSPVIGGPSLYGAVAVVRDLRRERELEQLRDSLISTVSHELRTPLTMVQGFAELLAEEHLSEDDRRLAVRQVNNAAQRLADLVDDILSAAAIQSGRMELIPERVEALEIVEGACRSFPPSEVERIEISVDAGLHLLADRDRCEQILTNLIGNSLKYSEAASAVGVTVRRKGAFAEFEVADRGFGIAPDDRDRLFEKFYRSHDSRVRHLPGTGLGLFIVQHIVDLHRGTIEIASALGEGSVATVKLPIAGPPQTPLEASVEG